MEFDYCLIIVFYMQFLTNLSIKYGHSSLSGL